LKALTFKILVFVTFMFFAAAILPYARANGSDQIGSYDYGLYNLKIHIENPAEAYPSQNLKINVTAEAAAKLTVNYIAIELYTFNSSTMNGENFTSIEVVNYSTPLFLPGGLSPYEASFVALVPVSAFNVVYAKLILVWTEIGTEESTPVQRQTTFIMASVYNPELERLRDLLPKLQKQNAILRRNVTCMNDSLAQALNDLTDINNTLTQAFNNLTDATSRYQGDIGNTRTVATVLGVTTVFFVATTVYLTMKKPRDYF
jgi:hypothetical protein